MFESEWGKLPAEAQLALQSGRKTEAVAIVRDQMGVGLAEARELVDRADRSNRDESLEVPRQVQGREDSGTLRLVVIVAILGALALAILWL